VVQVVETNNPFLVDVKDVALVIARQDKRVRAVKQIRLFRKNVVPTAENVGMEV
jgi:hypothetical protein